MRIPHPTLLALAATAVLVAAEPSVPTTTAATEASATPSARPSASPSPAPSAPPRPITLGPDQVIMPPSEFPVMGWVVADDRAVPLDTALASWRRRFIPSAVDEATSVTLDVSVASPAASIPAINCLGLTAPRVPLAADFNTAGGSATADVRSGLWSSAPFSGRAVTQMCRRTYGSNGTLYALQVVTRNVSVAVYVQAGPAPTGCCSNDERPRLQLAADVGFRQLAILERVAPP